MAKYLVRGPCTPNWLTINSRFLTSSFQPSVGALLGLLRPRQWIKNSFVLAPLVFARDFERASSIGHVAFAFVLFCIASSATYIANDIHDVERDRRHPVKKKRALASGAASLRSALVLLGVLYGLLVAGVIVMPALALPILAYLLLNVAYTYVLKNQPVLDIFSVAAGFVLRVYAGAAAIGAPLSNWMAITTLCLALYLASIKRRQELRENGAKARDVLSVYSVALVEHFAEMSAFGALLFYSLFVMSTNTRLVATIPFVIFGLFRYWYVVEAKKGGESPTDVLLTDWPLGVCIATWGAICVMLLLP
jgi:decaprenyl-phosphate phosphoribosyltransferase